MKTALLSMTVLALGIVSDAQASTLLPSASAWVTQTTTKTTKKKAAPTKEQKLIKRLKYIKTKANSKADYFILLNTASWCPPCRKAMPGIVEAYKDIKASKRVELIILSADRSEEAAESYLKGYKAKIPAVMGTPAIPGYVKSNGIPNVTIIDKNGKTIVNGGTSLITSWKKHTLDKEPQAEAPAE